jgi:hypothetical protein
MRTPHAAAAAHQKHIRLRRQPLPRGDHRAARAVRQLLDPKHAAGVEKLRERCVRALRTRNAQRKERGDAAARLVCELVAQRVAQGGREARGVQLRRVRRRKRVHRARSGGAVTQIALNTRSARSAHAAPHARPAATRARNRAL